MYKIEHFEQKFCRGGGNSYFFNTNNDNNNHCGGVYSIWQFCPWRWWQSLKQLLFYFPEYVSFCRPEWFALIYWLSLGISLVGIFYSLREFLAIYYGSWTLTTVQKEEMQVIPLVFRRNARLIGSVLMVKTWAGLFIGIATVTPSAISTWLAIYSATIFLDLILWIGVTLFAENKLDFRSCCAHLTPIGTFLLIRCVHGVFIREIERRANIEELELMAKLTKKW